MVAVHTFSSTSASFATAHATLAERLTRTEVAMAQTSAILSHNQAILMQIQSHMGLPAISLYVPAQAAPAPPSTGPVPTPQPAPADSFDVLAAAAVAATPPAAP